MNPHERKAHYALNVARLPIPPLRLGYCGLNFISKGRFVNLSTILQEAHIDFTILQHSICKIVFKSGTKTMFVRLIYETLLLGKPLPRTMLNSTVGGRTFPQNSG